MADKSQMEEALGQMKQEGDYGQYDYYMDLWKAGLISVVDVVYTSVTDIQGKASSNVIRDSRLKGKDEYKQNKLQ